jgi:hypothetical protein
MSINNNLLNKSKELFQNYCKKDVFIPTIYPKARRVVGLGDIHGDLELAIKLLILASVIDKKVLTEYKNMGTIEIENIKWIGGDTIIVQVGDQIDRCRPKGNIMCTNKDLTKDDEDSDIIILKLFTWLDKQAQLNNPPGKVISLLGNHELLNVQGYFNYVSYKGIEQFKKYRDPNNPSLEFNSGQEARQHAFKPGNEYAKFLACTRIGSVIIGSNLFVHAGIIDHFIRHIKMKKIYKKIIKKDKKLKESNGHIKKDDSEDEFFDISNEKTQKLVKKLEIQLQKENMENILVNSEEINQNDLIKINYDIQKWLLKLKDEKYIEDIISGNKFSMFWNRILGNLPGNLSMKDKVCKDNISNVMKVFKIGTMIIGHTPQSFLHNSKINGTCSNKVYRIDNGSSKAFNIFDQTYLNTGKINDTRKPQVMEILNDTEINIISE